MKAFWTLWLTMVMAWGIHGETITWYEYDLAPLFIQSGPRAGQGQLDILTQFLRSKLPEYTHRRQVANLPRIFEQLKTSDLAVVTGVQWNPERGAIAVFSAPFLATHPPLLVVRRQDAPGVQPFLDPRGNVDLEGWLRNHSLGLVAGRSYTSTVDLRLARLADATHLVRRYSPTELAGGLYSMLTGERVDGILAYESEWRAQPGAPVVTSAFSIQGVPEYVPLYLVSNRTPEGEALVRKINQILKEFWNDPAMRGPVATQGEFQRGFLAKGYQGPP